jgi:hypothetical protein
LQDKGCPSCSSFCPSGTCPISAQSPDSCVRLNDMMYGVLCILERPSSDSGPLFMYPKRFLVPPPPPVHCPKAHCFI